MDDARNAAELQIETESFFWATAFLALIEVAGGQEWNNFIARVSRDEERGDASIPGALDDSLAALSVEGGGWLPMRSSLRFREILAGREARKALGVVETHPCPEALLRHLIEWFIESDCFVDAGEDPSASVPQPVATVMAAFAKALAGWQVEDPVEIYLPSSCSPLLLRALRLALPGATVYGQDPSWRNVCIGSIISILEGAPFSFAAGPAIVDDAFTSKSETPLAVSVFPHELVCDAEIMDGDPRWSYYAPQRGREGYAWLQQALYHIGDKGFAVLCVPTGMLTTTHVKEFPTRRDLIEEGRIYAAVTLPGRLFRGSSNVAHLLVIGPRRPAQVEDDCPILFIDAQEMGQRLDGPFERTVSEDVLSKIIETFKGFMEGERPREIRFAALAQPADILDSNCDLVASSYVYAPEKITSNDPQVIEQGLSRLVVEFEEAASMVADLDSKLAKLLRGVLR